jgi:enoyl-CoA hydratase/carnithine racemase
MNPAVIERMTVPGIRVSQPCDGVTLLMVERPDRFNALDEPILLGLPQLLDALGEDPTTRALVVSGAGAAFCAGGDLDVIQSVASRPSEWTEPFLTRALRLSLSLHRLPQPTIAAVNGPVAGGGLGLAFACDVRVAAPTATFSAPFIHMGLVPDMGVSWLLPRLVGFGNALEFLLSGRRIEAEEAKAMGLVSRVCDDVMATAVGLAATFAAMPAEAATITKAMLRRAMEQDLEAAIGAEARHQSDALHGTEFADRYSGWRTEVTGAGF